MRDLDYALHYDISCGIHGYTLKVWEPVPHSSDLILYKLQYRLNSEEAAWALLSTLVNFMGSPISSTMTGHGRSGEVLVRPTPTLTL
jgi:hypothetical protein